MCYENRTNPLASDTRQKNQSDYVGRMLPGRPFIDQPIQRTVKPVDFLGGQKASEFRAGSFS